MAGLPGWQCWRPGSADSTQLRGHRGFKAVHHRADIHWRTAAEEMWGCFVGHKKAEGFGLPWLWLRLVGTQALNMGQPDAELAWGWWGVVQFQVYPNGPGAMEWLSMHPSAFLQAVFWRIRGSESLPPRAGPHTPQSSMHMPDGT